MSPERNRTKPSAGSARWSRDYNLLAEAGLSLEAIMERLGHQDDETTKNIYLHVTKPKKERVYSQVFATYEKPLPVTSLHDKGKIRVSTFSQTSKPLIYKRFIRYLTSCRPYLALQEKIFLFQEYRKQRLQL